MKFFDLEQAKAGAPVITRKGWPARIICFDKLTRQGEEMIALLKVDGEEFIATYRQNGTWIGQSEDPSIYDLFLAEGGEI